MPKAVMLGPWAGFSKRGAVGLDQAGQGTLPAKGPRSAGPRANRDEPELDPLARSLAVPGPVASAAPAAAAPTSVNREVADARELEEAVRRIAWGGDRRRGVARLELGGSYEGTVVTVRGEGREVSLRLELRPGTDARNLPERLVERLTARGLTVTAVELG